MSAIFSSGLRTEDSAARKSINNTFTDLSNRENGILARHFRSCRRLFKGITEALKSNPGCSRQVKRIFEDSYLQLQCWGFDLEIEDGALDSRLENSQLLYQKVLSLLVLLGQPLTQKVIDFALGSSEEKESLLQEADLGNLQEEASRALKEKPFPALSDDDDDIAGDIAFSSETDSIEETATYIATIVKCLLDLTVALERPARIFSKYQPRDRSPSQHFINVVRERFPNGDDHIVSRLGIAIWGYILRTQRKTIDIRNGLTQSPATSLHSSDQPNTQIYGDPTFGKSIESQTGSQEHSYFQSEHPSSSVPTVSEPFSDARETAFTCHMCDRKISNFTEPAWRQHIYGHLKPYVCIMNPCPSLEVGFGHRKAWVMHLRKEHQFVALPWKQECCLCRENIDGQHYLAHIAAHMEAAAIPTLASSPVITPESPRIGTSNGLTQIRAQSDGVTAHDLVEFEAVVQSLQTRCYAPLALEESTNMRSTPRDDQREASLENTPWRPEEDLHLNLAKGETPLTGVSLKNSSSARVEEADRQGKHSPYTALKCQFCSKRLSTSTEYQRHVVARHEKPFKCTVSGCTRKDGFGTSGDLKRHQHSVHKQGARQTYRCHSIHCKQKDKRWRRLDNLKAHLNRLHTGEDLEALLESSKESSLINLPKEASLEGPPGNTPFSFDEDLLLDFPEPVIENNTIVPNTISQGYTDFPPLLHYEATPDLEGSFLPSQREVFDHQEESDIHRFRLNSMFPSQSLEPSELLDHFPYSQWMSSDLGTAEPVRESFTSSFQSLSQPDSNTRRISKVRKTSRRSTSIQSRPRRQSSRYRS